MKIRTFYGIPRSISIGLTISFILVFFVLEAMSSQPHALKHTILDKSLLTGPSKFDYDVNNKTDFRMGFVETIGFEEATVGGLLATRNGSTYIGVNYKDQLPTDSSVGRRSVNLWSYVHLSEGPYILDILHAPTAACGLWSSILLAVIDTASLFESFAINPSSAPWLADTASIKCFQAKNDTIRVRAEDDTDPFASAINNEGGATYAFEWRADMVNVWIWMGASAPIEVKNESTVDPTTWGPPRAQYLGDCRVNMDKKQELNMRIYTTFCPPLARDDYYRSDCFRTAPSCYQYVANNPSAYQNAYWLINHIKVYERSGEVAMNDADTIPTIQSPE